MSMMRWLREELECELAHLEAEKALLNERIIGRMEALRRVLSLDDEQHQQTSKEKAGE